MKPSIFLLDIIFYMAVPLLVWSNGKGILGDYRAMLASSVPGIIYTVYRMKEVKTVNFTGVFMMLSWGAGTLMDFLSGSSMQLLWNNVFYAAGLSVFYLATAAVGRPAAVLFSLDLLELQGHDRKIMADLFYERNVIRWFNAITLLFALRELITACTKIVLIRKHGSDAFFHGIILQQLTSAVFAVIVLAAYLVIFSMLKPRPKE